MPRSDNFNPRFEMKVEIYSDIVCPWCYIGKRRFERAVAEFGGETVEVVFRPYQLDPDAPADAVPLADYLQKRFGGSAGQMTRQVGGIAAAEGISIDWDRALAVNTLEAHNLLGFVERTYGAEMQKALVDRLYAAHFTDGLDVGDRTVLVRLAEEVGADATAARAALESGDESARVLEEIEEAREMGIKAVPTFIFDGLYMVEGAQAPTVFRQVLEEVSRKGREAGNQ